MTEKLNPIVQNNPAEEEIYARKNALKLQLECFNGPLDVLLSMVKEAKIQIKDIFLSTVTDQFLSYMAELDSLDVERGSEYMEITATLLEIKSRALLPEPPKTEENEETPEQEIIRRLDEFRLLKEASERLKEKENVDRFYKAPDPKEETHFVVKDMSIENLLDAFARLMLRNQAVKEVAFASKEIAKDVFTVADRITYLQERINKEKQLSFFEIFSEKSSRNEIVVTFSALLELMKMQYLKVTQDKIFGDIIITKNSEYNGSEELTYDDNGIG